MLSRAEHAVRRISGAFRSDLHDERLAAHLGLALGIAFTVCLITGMVDWAVQNPPTWFRWPSRPVNLYRITQGVHVLTGVATIPLLLAKLWVVYPRFFAWPPVQNAAHALERLSLLPLVGGSLFLLFTGVLNIAYAYGPMPFFFPAAHFWVSWVTVGALIVHIGAKATQTAESLRRPGRGTAPTHAPALGTAPAVPAPAVPAPAVPAPAVPAPAVPGALTRRGLLTAVAATSGVLVASIAGETIAPLDALAVLAPRRSRIGPQHLPVNQSAVEAQVVDLATDPAYRLAVTGRCERPVSLSLAALRSLPQRQAGLPISCVEGWSAAASWRGVPVRHLLEMVGAPAGARVRVVSLEAADRLYSSSVLEAEQANDPDTLLALELNGQVLDLDHGYPVRLIAPDRAGVLQTKWLGRVEIL